MAVRDQRIPLLPRGPFAAELRADLLAGHLCWYLAQSEGEAGARRMLEACAAGALRLSDPFPAGYLPIPLEDPALAAADWESAEARFLARATGGAGAEARGGSAAHAQWHALRKRARRLRFVAQGAWRAGVSRAKLLGCRVEGELAPTDLLPPLYLPGESAPTLDSGSATRAPGTAQAWDSLHTAVDRQSDGALEGTLHERVGVAYAPGTQLEMYLRCEESEAPRYAALLAEIGLDGHLKHASSGWGRFGVGLPRTVDLAGTRPPGAGDRWVSLSPCVPEEGYPGEACYRLLAHFGKLGGAAPVRSVFKHPLLLLATGATFRGPMPQGRWLTGIHPEAVEAVHYAFAYPLAC
ncbi:MAG: hypothetical protein HZA54_11400 [Planctomycetes bacterium]|nr:hypothetical protein [Planctomycetota bacterium]